MRFVDAWRRWVSTIQKEDEAMQTSYDAPTGTDHGQKQDNWDWKAHGLPK